MKRVMFCFLICILVFLNAQALKAQDTEYVLTCIANIENPVLSDWYLHGDLFPITDNIWQDMVMNIEGNSIWVGYANGGWNVPNDLRGRWMIKSANDESMEAWIWQSRGSLQYYVFPFDNTELFADSNGNHYGQHPCGGWEVDFDLLSPYLLSIINQ